MIAGLISGSFYILQFKSLGPFAQKPQSEGVVAGAVCEETGQLSKEWLLKYFSTENECDTAVGGAEGDPDKDALRNVYEQVFDTDPTNQDTDGDGQFDGIELAFYHNPKGEGYIQMQTAPLDNMIESLGPEYEQFTEVNIQKKVEEFLDPAREIALDFPNDNELVIVGENSRSSFEKYYEDTKQIKVSEEADLALVQGELFNLSEDQLNELINKLQAKTKILMQTPVPSDIMDLHKLRIASYRAGIRMFELIRDSYNPDINDQQFWSDLFYQIVAVKQASTLELFAWKQMYDSLREKGEL